MSDTARAGRDVEAAQRTLRRLLQTHGSPAAEAAVRDTAAQLTEPLAQVQRALSVALDVYTEGDALPGEDLAVKIAVTNRGTSASTGGSVTLSLPSGWAVVDPIAVGTLAPGQTKTVTATLRVPIEAKPGDQVTIAATTRNRVKGNTVQTTGSTTVTVQPAVEITVADTQLALAAGGYTATVVTLSNRTTRKKDVTLTATGDEGVSLDGITVAGAAAASTSLTVPASGGLEVTVGLRGAVASGTGTLQLSATTATGARSSAPVVLIHGTDLARNGVGARFPKAFASSTQGTYAPANFNDADAATFWVSGGSVASTGPTKVPVDAGVEFGAPVTVGSVTVGPRVNGSSTNYGPKNYTVDVTTDGTSWRTVAIRTGAPNARHTTTLPGGPVQASAIRLHVTDAYDSQAVARNVQMASLEVRP